MIRAWVLATAVAALTFALVAAPAQAAFPGRNGKLAFQRLSGERFELFTTEPSGSATRRLAGTPLNDGEPAWSPDGTRLAFSRFALPEGVPSEIWTMNAQGGDVRQLTAWGSLSGGPAWSPTGAEIIYSTIKDFPPPQEGQPFPPDELYTVTADGAAHRRLTNDQIAQADPVWSPDGSRIAFAVRREVPDEAVSVRMDVYVMNADGAGVRRLVAPAPDRDTLNPNWSPDGRKIAFELSSAKPPGKTGPGRRQSDIAVVDADGSDFERLTRTPMLETNPVWSPDGTRIAFTGDRHQRRGTRERLGPAFELYTMRANGTRIQRLTRNRVPDLFPDWQPLPRR